jgi:RNA polymerase sigma-70 factor (ECF subfamily)
MSNASPDVGSVDSDLNSKDLFEILVRDHADMLSLYLRCAVSDSTQVDDLFQETLLTAWKILPRFDRTRPFGPWLRGIASKLILVHRRKQARRFLFLDEQVLEHLESRHAALAQMPGDTLGDKLDSLRDCLRTLPDPYRQAVELRYHVEMSSDRLAQRLSISAEALKKRLQRGRAKLLVCLKRKLSIPEAAL